MGAQSFTPPRRYHAIRSHRTVAENAPIIHAIGLTAAPPTDLDSDATQLIHYAPLILGYPRQLALVENIVTGHSVTLHSPLHTTLRHLLETASIPVPDGGSFGFAAHGHLRHCDDAPRVLPKAPFQKQAIR